MPAITDITTVLKIDTAANGRFDQDSALFDIYWEGLAKALDNGATEKQAVAGVAEFARSLDGRGSEDSPFWVDSLCFQGPVPEGEDPLPCESEAEAFVSQLYRTSFQREGAEEGVDFWSGKIAEGEMNRFEVFAEFVTHEEAGYFLDPDSSYTDFL